MKCERSQYLFIANRADTRIIARFRHNRLGHNESMYRMNLGRIGTTPTPNCTTCPTSAESIEHLLLHCPAYTADRDKLSLFLRSIPLPLTLPVLLAEELSHTVVTNKTAESLRRTRQILQHIATFLRQICTIRQLTII